MGIGMDVPLPHADAFALLPEVSVAAHGDIPAAAVVVDYFRTRGKARWSGLALPLGDGRVLVLYNDAHPITRTRATLMEEFFHIVLGHRPSEIRLLDDGDGHRTHDKDTESEAYACGAAALVPYRSLKTMFSDGTNAARIATHFRVSTDLVYFRLKVTRLVRRARGRRT
jgi:Zn-dependent peptidase ImmA (M78 family)